MSNFKIIKAKTIEIPITTIGVPGTLPFPINMNDLNTAEILAIQCVTSTQMVLAPSGRPNITNAMMAFLAMSLAKLPGSDDNIDTIPLYSTNRELNSGEYYELVPFQWNPSACQLKILSAGLALTDSIVLIVYYRPL